MKEKDTRVKVMGKVEEDIRIRLNILALQTREDSQDIVGRLVTEHVLKNTEPLSPKKSESEE